MNMVGKDTAPGCNDIAESSEVIILLKDGDVDRISNPFAERCDKGASETANSSPVTMRVGEEEAGKRCRDQLYRRHVGPLVLGVFPLKIGFEGRFDEEIASLTKFCAGRVRTEQYPMTLGVRLTTEGAFCCCFRGFLR
jgi:hypothetical protein